MAEASVVPASDVNVQLCYAQPGKVFQLDLTLPAGSTMIRAIEASGVLQLFPDIDLGVNKVGIFGKQKPAGTLLREGDRVEIYRSLQADPKESRRRRARRSA